MIAIIDYDAGNIKSVEKALLSMGETPVLTRDPEVILQSDHIILPGVGSFGDAMENLNKFGLIDVIHEAINRKMCIRDRGIYDEPSASVLCKAV